MKLTGRVLWLTQEPKLLQRQLEAPTKASFHHAGDGVELAYGVNTDAIISGAACTLGYTPEILGPYFLEDFKETVTKDSVRAGGFQVIVGGHAYGSGSSREAAVVAHLGAGIELVVARSFQRIFQENMVYCGLPFTTDVEVADRLVAGEEIDLRRFTEDLPAVFRAIASHGGLLRFGSRLLEGTVTPPYDTQRQSRPQNCIEKIIAQNVWQGQDEAKGVASVEAGEQVLCSVGFRGMHEYTAGMVMSLYASEWQDAPVSRPEAVAAFEDHFVLLGNEEVPPAVRDARLAPAQALRDEMIDVCQRYDIRVHGPGRDHPAGVCHRLVVERYAQPGSLILLTDSHTPTAGVQNAFAFGVGSTAMAFALRTGLIPVTVPKTVRVVVSGDAADILSPKDLILHIIGDPYFREEQWRSSPTDTCVIQFGGPGLDQWSVDELSVLTNMTVEGGLMTGVVEPCDPLRRFLEARGDDATEFESRFVFPDDQASYVRTWEIELRDIPLTVATPGDSRNRKALAELGSVPIHNVVIASCTGGSYADLAAAAKILRGRKLHPGVRVTVTPSSTAVADSAQQEGILQLFRDLGVIVTEPGCGSCIGNGPGVPLAGETTASTTNRNFDRRMGAPGPVYLVSPAVAAASAVKGKITDPRQL